MTIHIELRADEERARSERAQGDEQQANIDDAKLQLSKLVECALEGEDIIIVKGGAPILRLVPVRTENCPRLGGQWKGRVRMAEDFDTLPDDIATAFGIEPT